ncbi:MAG: hypothetical protein KC493_01005 [Bacteriovoracaceae bacterium]|nr:hypothetical protein [Bacteriovoracaceae bacterium]
MKIGILLALMTFGQLTFAQAKPKTTQQVMNQVFDSFVKLVPYMNNEMKFQDPKSSGVIISNLTNISNAFKNSEHIKTFQTPGFQPSYDVVKDHVQHTIDAFNTNNKLFARTRLKATASLCISCHTQLSGGKRGFIKSVNAVGRGTFDNDFEYGEFLFVTRNFNKSVRYLDRAIENRIKTNKELQKINKKVGPNGAEGYLDRSINQALRRMLTIYTKVYFRPDKAITLLSKYENHKGLSKMVREDVQNWMKQLRKWRNSKTNYKLNKEADLRKFISSHLDPIIKEERSVEDGSHDVTLLVASGFLTKFLNQRGKSDLVPEILYWLSIADRTLNFNFFYSLSDVYLKECIVKYPKSTFASKCYKEYEQNVIFGYSGSGGTSIPEEEKKELQRLKKILQ